MISIGDRTLLVDDFYRILFKGEKINIADAALEKVDESYYFLKDFSKDKVIYGINTGLGPMAQYRINETDQIELQYNLIRSHSAGCGNTLPDIYVKSLMVARLNTLLKAYSGINMEAVLLLKELINREIYPQIFEHGGVGASGDLVQLAHLALILIGEGEVRYKGEILPTEKVFEEQGLKPMRIHLREGLALINGTSVMSGIGMINIILAKNLLEWSVLSSALINEIVESFNDHFSSELNSVKMHKGQQIIAESMRNLLSDSKLIKKRPDHLFNKKIDGNVFNEKVQEYYSLRCVPQILGPIHDTLEYSEAVIINEINSVNDNPVVDISNNNVFHGGNFHGDYISLEMDKIKIAVTKLSMLTERQLNFLMNNKLNNILPPFANLGRLGLNLGMQGTQFTATSTVAENQTLSFPMYIHSIPNNNDNQDIVSMGTNAALIAKKVIENSYEVQAIELISLLQSVDYLKFADKLSKASNDVYEKLRKIVPCFEKDNIKYKEIANIKKYLMDNHLNFIKL